MIYIRAFIFYSQLLLSTLWFLVSTILTFPIAIIRWRHPSNGFICAQIFTHGVMFITGIKLKIHNKERLSNQPCIYLGNHQNNADVFVHAYVYRPRTIAIGKKEIMWLPFFGALFYLCRNILLDRKNHDKAILGLGQAQDSLKNHNISIYMFPEGTRNKGAKELLPFKKGAFRMALAAQVPLIPIVASPIDVIVDFKNKKIHRGTINLEVLEPIPTKGLTLDDMEGLIAKVHQIMQSAYDRSHTDLD
jgi:1-acyl-sn-glycerol-3-phosphate acyltransferase